MDPAVVALVSLLTAASAIDLRTRRIPNVLVGLGIVLGFVISYEAIGPSGLWFSLKGALAAFALFLPLFLLRAFGAGDVKLMMAVGSLVGTADALVIAMLSFVVAGAIALSGGVIRGRVGGILSDLKLALFALASRDLTLGSDLAQASEHRVPFAAAALLGAIAWLLYLY